MGIEIVAGAIAAAASAASAINGMSQAKQQEEAQKKAQRQANAQASTAEQAMNRENQKSTDTNALLDAAAQAGKAGASGTMLTGAQGVDSSALSLGKNTLLGG